MTEFEKKLMLTKDEYDYLMQHLGHKGSNNPKPIVNQINYYFDTDNLCMNRQNITCRIRWKDGKYKATMKQHSLTSDYSIETEMNIYDGLNNNAFTDMGLKLQGFLSTERCVIIKSTSCEAVLDKNEYLGYTDYELEIEYISDHEKEAQAILQMIRVLPNLQLRLLGCEDRSTKKAVAPSKSTRFFERKAILEQALQKNPH